MKELKIIIVDDHKEYRTAVKAFLQSKFKYCQIDEAGNAEELMKLKDFQKADLILMDIMMPGMNGIELTKDLLWNYRSLKIIAYTMFLDNLFLPEIIGSGCKGWILKEYLQESLEECFRIVLGGELYYPNYLKQATH
jgi:DNA-binding NarL/FixJ family response regulator